MFLADQPRSSSTTSHAGIMFRFQADPGRKQRFRSIGIEERPQAGIPPHDVRHIDGANTYVSKEANDLFVSFRYSLLDKRQTLLAIDRVKRLEHQTVSPLPTL